MKRISKSVFLKRDIISRKRWRKDLARALKKKNLRRHLHYAALAGVPVEERMYTNYNINAPEHFNLSSSFEEVAVFLNTIRRDSLRNKRLYSINFKTIKDISPAGALVLTAEIDRWRRIKGRKLRPAELSKWNPQVRRLLNEMGFFEVLNIDNSFAAEDTLAGNDLTFIKFLSGDVSDGQYARQLRLALEPLAGTIDARVFMYNGLIEAMSNSVEHAYPREQIFPPAIFKRWWMSGSYHKGNGRLTVMLYDQGVGIPATLPSSPFWDALLNFIGLDQSHGTLIKAAMSIGKTQTLKENRGLGLHEMREFIVRSGRGTLRIVSQKGDYTLNNREHENVKDDHRHPLSGTLIAWEIYTKDDENE